MQFSFENDYCIAKYDATTCKEVLVNFTILGLLAAVHRINFFHVMRCLIDFSRTRRIHFHIIRHFLLGPGKIFDLRALQFAQFVTISYPREGLSSKLWKFKQINDA